MKLSTLLEVPYHQVKHHILEIAYTLTPLI